MKLIDFCVYTVNSSVLSIAFGESYLEGQTNRIRMAYSSLVVKALLKHLYYRNCDAATESFNMSLDLLRVADYYNIPSLWKDVVAVVLASQDDWFPLPQVFEALLFVSKSTVCHPTLAKLTEKLMNVLVK